MCLYVFVFFCFFVSIPNEKIHISRRHTIQSKSVCLFWHFNRLQKRKRPVARLSILLNTWNSLISANYLNRFCGCKKFHLTAQISFKYGNIIFVWIPWRPKKLTWANSVSLALSHFFFLLMSTRNEKLYNARNRKWNEWETIIQNTNIFCHFVHCDYDEQLAW